MPLNYFFIVIHLVKIFKRKKDKYVVSNDLKTTCKHIGTENLKMKCNFERYARTIFRLYLFGMLKF